MPQPDFAQTLSKDRHFLRSAFKNPNKYGGLAKVEEKYKNRTTSICNACPNYPSPNSTTRCLFTKNSTKSKKPLPRIR